MDPKVIGAIISGAGQAQQDITGYITPLVVGNQQRQAVKDAEKRANKAYDKAQGYYDQSRGYYQPYYDTGTEYMTSLGNMIKGGEFDMPQNQFSSQPEQDYGTYQAQQFNFQADPGYQFRLDEGQRAINNGAAAGGGQLSGATLKALARFGSGLASQEYANAYGRYQDQRNFGYGQYQDTRDFLRNKYAQNRAFDYGAYSDQYDRQAGELNNRYNRYAGMANMGVGMANNMAGVSNNLAGLSERRGAVMADLALTRGNVNSSIYSGLGQASHNQGQGAKDFGGYMMGGGMSGGGGGMGSMGGMGGGMGGFDMNMMGGGGGSAMG